MNELPAFVVDEPYELRRQQRARDPVAATGWEAVVFQLDDDEPLPSSDFSTAAIAP
jgi:hypothetical protein